MYKIFKYAIGIVDNVEIAMPKYSQIVSFQAQGDTPCIWVMVNPDEEKTVIKHFALHGTGHEITNSNCKHYIGTCQTHGGRMVWHLFEIA
jgi:hypothetical protein